MYNNLYTNYRYIELSGDKGDKGDQGEKGEKGDKGEKGEKGDSATNQSIAVFYGLIPPNNENDILPGESIEFPLDYITNINIVRVNNKAFKLMLAGIYEIKYILSITQPAQLVVSMDSGSGFIQQLHTVVGRNSGSSQLIGDVFLKVDIPGSIICLASPVENNNPIRVTPTAGGTLAETCYLIVSKIF